MNYPIQPNINCEDCIVCGARPMINQTKKVFTIICSNKDCGNKLTAPFLDFDLWNKLNKSNVDLTSNEDNIIPLKRQA